MLLRSSSVSKNSAITATVNTTAITTTIATTRARSSSRKRKSVDDGLDEPPRKKQIIILIERPSSSFHPTSLVAPPSSSNPSLPSSPSLSESPLVGEVNSAIDDAVPLEDHPSQRAVEEQPAGNKRGTRRVHFDINVVAYSFESGDAPCRAADCKSFKRLKRPRR